MHVQSHHLSGITASIATDDRPSPKNKHVDDSCARYKKKHLFSTSYYPRSNGRAEATKTLIPILLRAFSGSASEGSWLPVEIEIQEHGKRMDQSVTQTERSDFPFLRSVTHATNPLLK